MKFFVSADMEGTAAVASWKEYETDYARLRRLFTREVEAVCSGILESGRKVDTILVCDAHASAESLVIEELPDVVQVCRGTGRPLMMLEGIDRSFDLAFFVGYHSGVGTAGSLMDHTYSSRSFYRIRVNGREVDEAMINAAVAGHFGVPLGFVSGDDKLVRRSKREFPGIETVTTKIGVSRLAAVARHPATILKELRAAAAQAASDAEDFKPYYLVGNSRQQSLEMELTDTMRADLVGLIPGSRRVDGRTVACRGADILELYRLLRLAAILAGSASAYL